MKNDSFNDPKLKFAEFYSNGIVAFLVIESMGFSYMYGSNKSFNENIKSSILLLLILIVMFLFVLIGGIVGINNLKNIAIDIFNDKENKRFISRIYNGKLIIATLFGIFPILLLLFFGIINKII